MLIILVFVLVDPYNLAHLRLINCATQTMHDDENLKYLELGIRLQCSILML